MARILIVDDEENILKSLRLILEEEGHGVETARDGRRGWEAFQSGAPDLVFLDIWLPEMDGLEVLRKIKEADPGAMVIMISGHGTVGTAVQAVKMGAFDFIEKPLSLDTVLLAVKQAGEFQKLVRMNKELREALKLQEALVARAPAHDAPAPLDLYHWGDLPARGGTQKTLKKSVVLYGVGLHSGTRTGLILQPLPPNSGIRFQVLPSGVEVPAHLSSIGGGGWATTLVRDGTEVKTVEHFLASCHAFGLSNLLVKVQGEIPVMDGSALEFCRMFAEAGVEDQGAPLPPVVIRKEYAIGDPGKPREWIKARPAETLTITYHLSYPPPVGDEDFTFTLRSPEDFVREIAPARTFGFMKDVPLLEKMGLGSGGRLNNFILIGTDGILNTTLRFPKEFARHKILDLLGDLYLLGRPIQGAIEASLTGHSDNQALLREIAKDAG